MYSNSLFLLFIVLCTYVVADARPEFQHDTIKWVSCEQNGSLPLTCGTLTVPLDYSDPTSNETLDLALVRVSAVKQPKKGSILFNPGGPGISGRDWIVGPYAEDQLVATGGAYDLIGFDTRYVLFFSSSFRRRKSYGNRRLTIKKAIRHLVQYHMHLH